MPPVRQWSVWSRGGRTGPPPESCRCPFRNALDRDQHRGRSVRHTRVVSEHSCSCFSDRVETTARPALGTKGRQILPSTGQHTSPLEPVECPVERTVGREQAGVRSALDKTSDEETMGLRIPLSGSRCADGKDVQFERQQSPGSSFHVEDISIYLRISQEMDTKTHRLARRWSERRPASRCR